MFPRAGQFRKRPWRLVSEFGFVNLLRFLLRRLDRQTAIEQASRVLQAQVGIVEMPFAEAAIDVDTRADLVTVENILARARKIECSCIINTMYEPSVLDSRSQLQ